MLSDQGKRLQARKRPAELVAMAPTNERAYVSRAAAAYDTQEKDLITKTRKIIAASNRALREAEAVLKRRIASVLDAGGKSTQPADLKKVAPPARLQPRWPPGRWPLE